MKRFTYVAFLFLLVTACIDKRVEIDKNTIKQLSKGDFHIPSRYGHLWLFINCGDSIGYTNIDVMHRIYMKTHSSNYGNFQAFLSDALNQKIAFLPAKLKYSNVNLFALNATIKNKYEQDGITAFIKLYCIQKRYNIFIVKNQYKTIDQLFTILYYPFINNYKVTNDDYIGEYIVSK